MADKIEIPKDELDKLLAEVGSEITEMLKNESAQLAKSFPGEEPPAEASEGSSGPSDPMPEETPGESHSAEASAPPVDAAPAPEASASPAPEASPEGDPAMDAPPSVEELQAEYAQLPPEQLKMHLLAAQAAMEQAMGGGAPAAPEASASPAQAPAAAPALAPAQAPAAAPALAPAQAPELALKSEPKTEGDLLVKAELDAVKAQLDDTNKALELLTSFVATPVRKSIKGLSDLQYITKDAEEKPTASASMSKTEIRQKLREKARTNLAKSDRELINRYTVGTIDVSKIEHLLTDK